MPDIIDLPANLKISDRTDPQLIFNSRNGGTAMNGAKQILSPLSEIWRFRAVIPIWTSSHARSIRVVKSTLKGQFNYLRVRLCDQYRISRQDIGGWSPLDPLPHSDGSYFSDGSGYGLAQPISPIMADAAEGSEILVVRASDFSGAMTSGVFFSVNDWLYQVDDWELDGTNYVLQISPPLRRSAAVGDDADFDAKSIWRLDADDAGSLDLQMGRFGSVTLSLEEPINR